MIRAELAIEFDITPGETYIVQRWGLSLVGGVYGYPSLNKFPDSARQIGRTALFLARSDLRIGVENSHSPPDRGRGVGHGTNHGDVVAEVGFKEGNGMARRDR